MKCFEFNTVLCHCVHSALKSCIKRGQQKLFLDFFFFLYSIFDSLNSVYVHFKNTIQFNSQ